MSSYVYVGAVLEWTGPTPEDCTLAAVVPADTLSGCLVELAEQLQTFRSEALVYLTSADGLAAPVLNLRWGLGNVSPGRDSELPLPHDRFTKRINEVAEIYRTFRHALQGRR